MIIAYLNRLKFERYLDNFILILKAILATLSKIKRYKTKYRLLTDCLQILRQEAKNCIGTIVLVFDIEIDTNTFVARIPTDKLQRARKSAG